MPPESETVPEPETELPLLSAHLPGTGGVIKADAEHFIVTEVPLYPASGAGEHIYLTITRKERETRQIVRDLTRVFQLREADIGTAGLKDRQARSTETFSLHLHKLDPDEAARRVESELGLQVDAVARHSNKLRTGHLAGNRFEILLTEPGADAMTRAAAKWEFLAGRAIPNYYGEQRFGHEGDNVRRGRDLILGRSRERPGKWLQRFLMSAYQSELFNRWLAARINDGIFLELLAGDVAQKTDSGGLFVVADLAQEVERFTSGAIDYTGPIFGKKMSQPTGRAAEREAAILATEGMTPDRFARARLDGTRRRARLLPAELDLRLEATESGHLRFFFFLPPGSYATVVLDEFIHGTGTGTGTGRAAVG